MADAVIGGASQLSTEDKEGDGNLDSEQFPPAKLAHHLPCSHVQHERHAPDQLVTCSHAKDVAEQEKVGEHKQ